MSRITDNECLGPLSLLQLLNINLNCSMRENNFASTGDELLHVNML